MDEADQMEVETEVEQNSDTKADKSSAIEISQLPWIEKYRPKSLSELIAHDEIINICGSLND